MTRAVALIVATLSLAVLALAVFDAGMTTVAAPANFINEILITNLNEPIVIQFLPDSRMLVVGRLGTIWMVQPGATQIDPTPVLQLTNISNNSSENGVFSVTLDPNFVQNQHFYLFYTAANPLRDRLSRFTLIGNTADPASELVIWQDADVPGVTHHGGSIGFGPDGYLYVSTGEHFDPPLSQQVNSFRGKILRMQSNGVAPNTNPFYVGNGQPADYVWALGLRNPFRLSFDTVTGRLYIADVGGNVQSTAFEEVNLGVAGANYGWPNCEGPCPDPAVTDPIFSYAHSGVHASITGGFVYRGTQFPAQYRGSYFYGDFVRNWIKGLTLDANGLVTGSFNFEPANGASDGPYGNISFLTEGPDGALYYVDYNYDSTGNQTSPGSVRRIRYTAGNQPPTVVASATPTSGPTPLLVNFSSAGTVDPENNPLTYSWDFGDGANSTLANPSHTYQNSGLYTARLTVSDGNTQVLSNPINLTVGNPPVAQIASPTHQATFIANDVINFSGSASDPDQGPLSANALTWVIVFHHGNHTHPILGPVSGISSGTYTIPNTGHGYSGQTSYEIILTATDADGLQGTSSVFIFPQKVNLTFQTNPAGLNLFLDGISVQTPLVLDTLVGFQHTLNAVDQSRNGFQYTFLSWSDGGAQNHMITTPATDRTYTATYNATLQLPLLQSSLDALTAVQNPAFGTGNGASVNTTPLNDFVATQFGNAVRVDTANEYVRFLQTSNGIQNVELDKGTVDFWYTPNSAHTDGRLRPLISIGSWGSSGSIHVIKNNGANSNAFGVNFRDAAGSVAETGVAAANYSFPPGTPVNIRVTWDFTVGATERNIHIYFNSVEPANNYFTLGSRTMPVESGTSYIYVGNRGDTSTFRGNGIFDELVILPDAIAPSTQDVTPPQRSNGQPSALPAGTTTTPISLTTDEAANCRYGITPGVAYASMSNIFSSTGGTSHSTMVGGLINGGSYNYYVRCQDDSGNANPDDFSISFSVAQQQDVTPPARSNGQPTGTLPAGRTSTQTSLTTNEAATCRYSNTSGIAFGSMPNLFSNTGGVAHSSTVSGLSDGGLYTFYVKCQDNFGNTNTDDFNISFAVDTSNPTPVAGLIVGYGFNEGTGTTTADLSGNGNTAKILGPAWTTGLYGNGLSFDGVNDYVTGKDIDFPTSPFTITAWFKTSMIRAAFIIGKYSSAQNQIYVMVGGNGEVLAAIHDGVALRQLADTGHVSADGNWHHVAVVVTATQLELFVEGVSRATAPHDNSFPVNSVLWNIGRRNNGAFYFNGVIDEVRLYNRALTPGEIQFVMQNPL